ncbi:MAG TPA: protein kinase [Chitinispirillaceae bacterium]|nr:protein kinase [Chitinispirillaceae bacterium]
MDQKVNKKKITPTDAWLKTISDIPAANVGEKTASVIKSPYAVPEMPPEVKIGEVLGSGTILDVLGEGGFARVYKIHDDKLDMDRAVKVLLPTGKKEVSDRFLTEARITARLDNTYIVKVFRVDEWNGCPFIEMEFIDGKSLETILQERGTFPVYAVCAVGFFIASALKYAHTLEFTLSDQHYKGVIHRDLKPANIMLHSDGRLKLMDFGIARPISTGLHTMGENIVGTLQYLSPEQLNHKGIDQRTDIYAVGAILYELLCGIKAFPDEGLTDLVNKKASGIYKPFGDFPVSVPKKLAEIIDKCLKVDKEERFNDAEALAGALTTVYSQFCSVEPEDALKNFMENPDYIPVVSKTTKKKQRVKSEATVKKPVFRMPQLRLPTFPKIRFPQLPKLKFPEVRLPEEMFSRIIKAVVNIGNKCIALIFRFLICFWKIPEQSVVHLVKRVKSIPIAVVKIGSLVLAVAAMVIVLFIFLHSQFQNKPDVSVAEKKESDTIAVPGSISQGISDSISKVIVPAPVLVSPAADVIWKSETLNVLWNLSETSDSFVIHIAMDKEFSDTVYFQVVSADTSCAVTDIEPGKYYCRIRAAEENGAHLWCTPHFFNFSPVYRTPHLLAPSRNDTCTDREVRLTWRKVPKAQGYFLNVAIDSNFTQLVFNDTNMCRDTFINVIFYDTSAVTYYWHVRTNDNLSWSSTHTFSVYDKRNYHADAAKALRKGRLSSVEKALAKIAPADQFKDTLAVRLAEEYLKIKNIQKVQQILSAIVMKDMMVEYMWGKVLFHEENYAAASASFDAAAGLSTCFANKVDSLKLFYSRAVAFQMLYESKKDSKMGSKAYYAWDSVKKMYEGNPSDEHYREALVKMNKLYHTDKIFGEISDTLKVMHPAPDSLNQPKDKKKKSERSFRVKPL